MGDAHWHCIDCSKDTDVTEEFYMLRNDLWCRLVRRPWRRGMLCLDCVERRLGRSLHKGDFANVPVNFTQAQKCPALARRFDSAPPHPSVGHDWRARRDQAGSIDALKIARKWRRR